MSVFLSKIYRSLSILIIMHKKIVVYEPIIGQLNKMQPIMNNNNIICN